MGYMRKNTDLPGYKAVMHLSRELDGPTQKYWFEIINICLKEHARTGGDFAGAWVFNDALKQGLRGFNNLRPLSSRGVISKIHLSRKGQRAYYTIPDVEGVKTAMKDLVSAEPEDKTIATTIRVPFFENLASCGSPNMSEAHANKYLDVDIKLTMPGRDYFVVCAFGDSMNKAGINDGNVLLIQSQNHANIGQNVVACTIDGITIKKLISTETGLALSPESNNSEHKIIPVDESTTIQGIVVTTLPMPNK